MRYMDDYMHSIPCHKPARKALRTLLVLDDDIFFCNDANRNSAVAHRLPRIVLRSNGMVGS